MPPQRGEPAATWQSRCPPPEAPEGSPAAVCQDGLVPQTPRTGEPEECGEAGRPAAVRLDAPQTQSDLESLKKAERLDAPQR